MQIQENPRPIDIAAFYAREDEQHLRTLRELLSPSEQSGTFTLWFDGYIRAGDDWRKSRDDHLRSADVIIFLVTPHFISSPECRYEVEQSMLRKDTCIVPIYVQAVNWDKLPYHWMNRLPSRESILSSNNPAQTWAQVAQELDDIIDGIRPTARFHNPQGGAGAALAPYLSVAYKLGLSLPVDVLAHAAGLSSATLSAELNRLAQSGLATITHDLCSVTTPISELQHGSMQETALALLAHVLDYIERHSGDVRASNQVRNILALGLNCPSGHPLVASAFSHVDEDAKNFGNKRLVLDLATMSCEAAEKAVPHTKDMKLHVARTLICGKSWAHQRHGELEDARFEAERGLSLALNLTDKRLQAFAAKSLGRIYRLEAEELGSSDPQGLLRQSVQSLVTAIRLFSEVYPEDSLERDLQVGDCYSLLGRTYLVGHDMGESRASIDRAYSLLQEGFNKPYVDLLLLDAEWQLKEHALSLSLAKYQETLELLGTHSASDTEMCARAHMGMGYYWKARLQLVAKKSRAYEKEQSFALTAFERAAEVYRGKDEQAHQARAEWEAALVREQFPQVLLIYLEKLRFPVRVAVIDEYHEYLQSRPGQGHRHPANPAITYRGKSSPEEPTEKQIREWISRAKEKVEMDERRW